MKKIDLAVPVIVEGKYDKAALASIVNAVIITTEGFGIFKNSEKRALIRRLSENGIIVLCDSDGAGGVIRSHISSFVPKDKLYQLYVPRIYGKERRKAKPSKEGVLGVEGVPYTTLTDAILRFTKKNPELLAEPTKNRVSSERKVTKTDFYRGGFSGGDGAVELRRRLAIEVGLPENMTANSLLAAINFIMTYDEYNEAVKRVRER